MSGMMSREERRRAQELEEARKVRPLTPRVVTAFPRISPKTRAVFVRPPRFARARVPRTPSPSPPPPPPRTRNSRAFPSLPHSHPKTTTRRPA
jgi:hypothetical protein